MCDPQTISLLIGMFSPIRGLILLCLQAYTYSKTRHNSVAVLTVSSVAGMACWGLSYWHWANHASDMKQNLLVLVAFGLLIIQCVLCVWGSAALFRTFRHLLASSGSGDFSVPVRMADIWRLWFLRRPSSRVTRASDRTIALTASIAILGWIALDRLASGANSKFMAWSLPAIGFYLLLALAVAYVTAHASVPRLPFRATLYVATAAMP
jgi:hypothetical protein